MLNITRTSRAAAHIPIRVHGTTDETDFSPVTLAGIVDVGKSVEMKRTAQLSHPELPHFSM